MSRLLHIGSRIWKPVFRERAQCLVQRRTYSVATAALERYRSGEKVQGYTINSVTPVEELSLTAVLLTHDKTKAKHLHVAREDKNNVFGVSFRTTPRDDTGVPHILEHTALCGSRLYPVRDPFFKMLTRSLNTFMNAFTASDWTMYPFSTQNPQDYRNLMSVYLDAAFFPRLKELDFMQEGWRLEHENPEDPQSPIVFKGVVYNEMKGVFSTAPNLFAQKCQNLLLPSHTYSTVYGGDPDAIPQLGWEQLRQFHASHYHPSNSRFYTYGNLPLEDHLQYIEEHALSKFDAIDQNTSVPPEPRWSAPREARMTCMPDPMAPDQNKQSTVTVSYLLGDITDSFESFTMSFISYLLVHGETAPFYQSLLEANIGSDYSPVVGYDGNTRDTSFSIGLQGISDQDVAKVKAIIEDTFSKVIREGFETERIDALLHKIELGQKHQTDKFGLNLGIGLLPSWTHDGDIVTLIQTNRMVSQLQEGLADNPRYLQDKVKQYFKDNSHKLTLEMHPDDKFESERQVQEDARLEHKVAALSNEDRSLIYKKGLELLKEQMKEPDVSCLPTLKVTDIPAETEFVETSTVESGGVRTQLCGQPTNGITYFRAVSDISGLRPELLQYVPLFCTVVTKMGAGVWDYKALSQQVDMVTGGLSASPHIIAHHTRPNVTEQGVMFSSYCLDRNVDKMFSLWQEIFQRLDLSDSGRLTTLVLMTASELANSVAGVGQKYAITNAASSLNPTAAVHEQMDGLTQVTLMKNVAESMDIPEVLNALKEIADHVLSNSNIRCAVNSTPEFMDNAQKSTEHFLSNIISKPPENTADDFFMEVSGFQAEGRLNHYELPFQVNYIGKAVPTVPYTHSHYASLRILATMMSTRYLHREIREKGGAYGGGAVGSVPGQFSFFSYRDPNLSNTLEAFEGAMNWALEGKFSQQDIDESKLAVFAQVDAPIPPGSKGLRQFLHHIDHTAFHQHRSQLFSVGRDDLISAAQQYLRDAPVTSISLLGPETSLSKDDKKWTVLRQ